MYLLIGVLVLGASCGGEQVGQWLYRDGSPVPNREPFVMQVVRGSDHCSWEEVLFMTMAWPLDQPVATYEEWDGRVRTYVWQTDAAYDPKNLATQPSIVTSMPGDTYSTGLHRGGWALWISPAHLDRAVFVTNGDTIQQWAFAEVEPACF